MRARLWRVHCVNAGHATWEEVALEVARQGIEPRLKRITTDQLTLRPPGHATCALATAKLAAQGLHHAHVAGRRGALVVGLSDLAGHI
jgi:hypothetical protein